MSTTSRPEENSWGYLDDQALLKAIANGAPDALGAMYDRYGRLVFSLACHITGDDRQAEEITQDVFVQVWNHADSYTSDRGKVTTWLTSIARHRAIDVLRRIDRRPEGHQLPWEDGLLNAQGNSEAVEDQIEFSVEKEILSKSIAQLPGEQRQVLALAYFQGYSHSEIAVATGEALGTIKTRIRLAMKKLRQALEERRL